eukprot:5430363-Amphidinium_carterae.1
MSKTVYTNELSSLSLECAGYLEKSPMLLNLQLKCRQMDGERERLLEEVKWHGLNLRGVPDRYRADREIVLAAVKRRGDALRLAAEECKAET